MSSQVYGESVELGDEIGPLVKRPTPAQVKGYLDSRLGDRTNSDTGRFLDAEAARLVGFPEPVTPGEMAQAYVAQLLTDWAGPAGRLQSLDVNFRRPAVHNEDLRCIALVTDVRPQGAETLVRVDVYAENPRGDRPVQGVGEVVLPTSA